MKTNKLLLGMLVTSSAFLFASCDEDPDVNVGPLSVISIVVDGTDDDGEAVSKELTAGATASGVPTDGVIEITFSKDVADSTITSSNVTFSDGANAVSYTASVDGAVVTLTPSTFLNEETTYTLTLTSDIVAVDGGIFSQITRSFLTVLAVELPDGLVAWWKFDDDATDESGIFSSDNEIDITYVEGRSVAARKAASFNGTTSIIEVPNGVNLTNTENFTLSFWMNLDSASYNNAEAHKGYFVLGFAGYRGFQFEIPDNRSNMKLVSKYEFGDGTVGNEDLWADCGGNLGWQGWTFSKDMSSTGGLKAEIDNQWVLITAVYNGVDKTGTIYLNGEKIKSQDFDLWPDDSKTRTVVGLGYEANDNVSTKFAIGFYSGISTTDYGWAVYDNTEHNHFKGQLDDMMIFHKAFSDAEVAAMYDGE